MRTKKTNDSLKIVLANIESRGNLPYSSSELINMGCKYATSLRSFLRKSGYIDNHDNQLKKINIEETIQELKNYVCAVNKGQYKEIPIIKENPQKSESMPKLIDFYSDEELVKELRNRGYEVSAIKTIAL